MPIGTAVIKRLSTVLAENELETVLEQELSRDETGQRLQKIPGLGPITASLLSLKLGDGRQCVCSRDFAASTDLVPRQYSAGEKIYF